ncbi:MAG: hypothetical protein KF850_34220 [Labilithrix sp.]|nr:hypothetical protein [Labilithrix sp.]
MRVRRGELKTRAATGNAAVAFYLKLRALAPRRTDLLPNDIAKYANRAVALSDDERRAVLLDLARLVAGELGCPACGDVGPHASNGHHRVGGIRFCCAVCATDFGVRDV